VSAETDLILGTRRRSELRFTRFPEAKGKTVSEVEIDPDANAILILVNDDTALSFDIDPSYIVFPELSRRKSGNWRPLKKWPPQSEANCYR
jgi:hypothetical protein